jgi:hypothetical protein
MPSKALVKTFLLLVTVLALLVLAVVLFRR